MQQDLARFAPPIAQLLGMRAVSFEDVAGGARPPGAVEG